MPAPQSKIRKVDRVLAASVDTIELIKNEKIALGRLEDQLYSLMFPSIAPFRDRETLYARRIALQAKFGLFYQEIQRQLPNGNSKTDFLERAEMVERDLDYRMRALRAISVQIEPAV